MRVRALRNFFVIAAIGLGGCSKPVLEIAEPSEMQKAAAEAVLQTDIGPPRNIAPSVMKPVLLRVLRPVRTSAYQICKGLELPDDRCDLMLTADVILLPHETDINAFADRQNKIGVFGGLVSNMGTDAEIAAVLAHEFSHVMYGHVKKKTTNALVGMAIAGGIAAALSSRYGVYDEKINQDFMQAGAKIGSRAYSPEMEIEADRTAIYILQNAGFPITAMQDVIVRMNRAEKRRKSGFSLGRVGFLQTHPSDDRRVAHIVSATEDAEAGVSLKIVDR